MRIGVVSIGNDSLELFRFLNNYDFSYLIYYDANSWPLGDKSADAAEQVVKKGIDYLLEAGVDIVIVPPLWESFFRAVYGSRILPLFESYVFDVCFSFSLVGKLGVLSDPLGCAVVEEGVFSLAQSVVRQHEEKYVLSEHQKSIRKFQSPMAYRVKDVRMWKYLLRSLEPRNFLVNKLVKYDLRYFMDANVDTVIPSSYAFFAFEKTIQRFFNWKKCRFHGLSSLQDCFEKLVEGKEKAESYSVTVCCHGDPQMLLSRKRYIWLLAKGKDTYIEWKML